MKNRSKELSAPASAAFEELLKLHLFGPDGKLVLLGAMRSYDRFLEAGEQIRKHGMLTTDDRGNLRKNPACDVEAVSFKNFVTGLKHLDLDVSAVEDILAKA